MTVNSEPGGGPDDERPNENGRWTGDSQSGNGSERVGTDTPPSLTDTPADMPWSPLGPLALALEESLTAGASQPPIDESSLSDTERSRLRTLRTVIRSLQLLRDPTPETDSDHPSDFVASRLITTAFVHGHFGRFHIERLLGHGGHGVVYLALDPILGRRIALKIPQPEVLLDPEMRERFLREARSAALLNHPNIVSVYEAGATGGVCFIAMEYCPGRSLAEFLAEQPRPRLSPCGWANVFLLLADALGYTHERGVLHRDVKPGNILLFPVRNEGQDGAATNELAFVPKLTDFGLAKVLEESATRTRTQLGAGTPLYMSPEQAARRRKDVDGRSDVHGLGVVMYEALTGKSPFEAESLLGVLEAVRQRQPMAPRRVNATIPTDLSTICLKCLEKSPNNRYQSAAELAADLRRFLRGEPVLATPVSLPHRLAKWARRRPMTAALLAVIAASIVSLVSVAGVYAFLLGNAHEETGQNRLRAHESHVEAVRLAYDEDIQAAVDAYQRGDPDEAVNRLTRYLPSQSDSAADDMREFAWRYLWERCHNRLLTLRGHSGAVYSVTFSPDGVFIATAGADGIVRIWNALGGSLIGTLSGHVGDVNFATFSPDAHLLVSSGADGTVRIWDVHSRKPLRSILASNQEVFEAKFSPDGNLLAAGGKDGVLRVWNTNDWQLLASTKAHSDFIESIDFSPDGKTLASAGADSTVALWDAGKLELRAKLPAKCGEVYCVRFSPAGGLLGAVGQNGQWILWNSQTHAELRCSKTHAARVYGLAFSPDGRRVVTAGADRTARLWDVATGQLEAEFKGHVERLWHAAFSPDGTTIATASSDGTVKLCKLSEESEVLSQYRIDRGQIAIDERGSLHAVSRAGTDGREVATYTDNVREVWRPPNELATTLQFAGLNGNGSAAVADVAGHLYFRSSNFPWRYVLAAPFSERWPPAISADGRLLAVGRDQLRVFDTHSWQCLATIPFESTISSVRFSDDGRRLVAMLLDGRIFLWNVEHPTKPRILPGEPIHDGFQVSFSPDNRLLAVSGFDGRVRIINAENGSVVLELPGHGEMVYGMGYSRDGVDFATAEGRTMHLWDTRTGHQLLEWRQPDGPLSNATFSPDSQELLGSVDNKHVSRWTAPFKSALICRAVASDPLISTSAQVTVTRSVRPLPLGAPVRDDVPQAFERFARLLSSRNQIIRPTFDDREDDDEVKLGALVLPTATCDDGPQGYKPTANVDGFGELSRGADEFARKAHGTAGYPRLINGYASALVLLDTASFERRDVPAAELGDIDNDIDRFREVNRWAKKRGFVGGFPTFEDRQSDGHTMYGAVLLKPGFADEVYLPSTSVLPRWQPTDLSGK